MLGNNDIWAKICKIQASLKKVVLLTEQVGETETLIQVTLEQRNALDHIIRATSRELKVAKMDASPAEEDANYIQENYDKALGHVYRGFFDACDWSCIVLREKVTETLQPYTTECITKVLPDYYSRLRPRLDQLTKEVSRIREAKDIADNQNIIPQVDTYETTIMEMIDLVDELKTKTPSLEEYTEVAETERKKAELKGWVKNISLVLLGAIISVILSELFG